MLDIPPPNKETKREKRRIVLSLSVVGLIAAAVTMAAATAKPAQATPNERSVCTTCHSGAPVGSVVATPSKTVLAPGEAYSVSVAVDLSAERQRRHSGS